MEGLERKMKKNEGLLGKSSFFLHFNLHLNHHLFFIFLVSGPGRRPAGGAVAENEEKMKVY